MFRDKAFDVAKNPKYDRYQRGLASMVYKFFDKKSALFTRPETLATRDKSASGSGIKNENMLNKELAEELRKPIIRKFKIEKYTSFLQIIFCGGDLADMQLISKFNKEICFLLCVIDIFSKHAWVIPLKDKKGNVITNDFQKNNQMNLIAKYGQIKAANFIIHQLNHVQKKMQQKCIQYITKETLLLLKDLLIP